MYVTLRDRPAADDRSEEDSTRRAGSAPLVVTLGMVSLLTDISSESVSAILPLYLTSVLGLSTISYGFVDALYQGVSSLVRIGGGWAADRGGRPKWVAFTGYALSAVARLALLFSTGLAAISAVISADRIGKGIRTAPRDAMISAASPPDRLGLAFGVHRTLDTTGATLGPLIAFALLWWIPDGYRTVMVVSLAFAVAGVALLGLLVPDRPAPEAREPREPRPPFRWRQVLEPGLVRLLVVAGVLGILTVGDGFMYLALLDRGGFAAHWFPLLLRRDERRLPHARHPRRPLRRPGRQGERADLGPRRPAGRLCQCRVRRVGDHRDARHSAPAGDVLRRDGRE